MSHTRPKLGPPPAKCCSALFFFIQPGKESSHPTAYCFQTGSLQLHSSLKNLVSNWVSLRWKKKGGELTQRAVRSLCVCPCVWMCVRAHGGKYEQSRPERVLRVLDLPFSVARQQQMFIWATLLLKCRGERHSVLRRPEVTLEEKSITTQDVWETLISQWLC